MYGMRNVRKDWRRGPSALSPCLRSVYDAFDHQLGGELIPRAGGPPG